MWGSALKFIGGFKPMTLIFGLSMIAMLGLAGWQAMENAALERKLKSCKADNRVLEADVAIHHAKVSELIAAVAEQNAELKRVTEFSDSLALEAAQAALQVIEIRAKRKENVRVLASQIGESCMEGIELVNQELGLK